jgi:hypothetical protein
MINWNISLDKPYSLTLAADARFAPVDYINDQIWECTFGTGASGGIEVHTTYGLRAKSMRIFPQFIENHQTVIAIEDYYQPPIINFFTPNMIGLSFSPFIGIEIHLELWVSTSQTLLGKIEVQNSGVTDRNIIMDWVAMLDPIRGGSQMEPEKLEGVSILSGKVDDLSPTFFMTGGATNFSSPFPTLRHKIKLLPTRSRKLTWVLTSLQEKEDSFTEARKWATKPWDAHKSKFAMVNQNSISIETGNENWNISFAVAQKIALGLLQSPNNTLQYPTFVSTRLPDFGYSISKDGTDYTHLWNGQSSLESWYFIQYLLPGNTDIAKGILKNFVNGQKDSGNIPLKIGLNNQSNPLAATPLLSTIALQIFEHTNDEEFITEVFPPLLDFFYFWFSGDNDKNQDGIPEWQHPLQTSFPENEMFSKWEPHHIGVDINAVGSPELCTYLIKECQALILIAELIGAEYSLNALQAHLDTLISALQNAWSEETKSFPYWDYENFFSRRGEIIDKFDKNGRFLLEKIFDNPIRLFIIIKTPNDLTNETNIKVKGILSDGSEIEEHIHATNATSSQNSLIYTGKHLMIEIISVEINRLPDEGEVTIQLINHFIEDHTQLIPIWSNTLDRQIANSLIQNKINPLLQYGKPNGIPAVPYQDFDDINSLNHFTWLPINTMILEGLIQYQAYDIATDLFTRIMDTLVRNLTKEKSFRTHYHASKDFAIGERNSLTGLPPIGVFMKLVGIKIHSQWKVSLVGKNPFPWPVRISYLGLKIIKDNKTTDIIFPNGKTTKNIDIRPCTIEISNQ